MKSQLTLLKCLLLGLSHSINCVSFAFDAHTLEQHANTTIEKLYNMTPNYSISQRIDWFSAYFKEVPYVLGSLGEGPFARYDQFPRYRTDAFDCETYVDTVIALTLSNSLPGFKRCINLTRYKEGTITYLYRNHFTDLDWNTNNQQRGVLKDITFEITDQDNKSVALTAEALIDKPNWYAHKDSSTIRLNKESSTEQKKRLIELQKKGARLEASTAKIAYIPLNVLFANGKPNIHLFKQIPHGSIIEIIRPNWDLRSTIGTALNVSHMGFAIWIKNRVYFREASSVNQKVVDVPLISYLKKALSNPTIKGINVQVLLPDSPRC